MTRSKKQSGITMTELLVASVLVGIVMLGVASFGFAIKRLQSSTNKSTILAMRIQTVMTRIARDVYRVVGDETNRGIVPFVNGSDTSLCLRHDTLNTPSNYNDDEWTCYFQTNNPIELYLCGGPPTDPANVPVQNMADCDADAPGGAGAKILELDPAQPAFYQIHETATVPPRLEYVEIILAAIYDHNDGVHPISNPQDVLTTRISPPGHTR